jgi:hypothetical protein
LKTDDFTAEDRKTMEKKIDFLTKFPPHKNLVKFVGSFIGDTHGYLFICFAIVMSICVMSVKTASLTAMLADDVL